MVKLDNHGGLGRDVAFQRVFAADRLADADGLDRTVVDTPGKIVVELAGLPEKAAEHGGRGVVEVAPGVDAVLVHLFGRYGADTPEGLDRKAVDKLLCRVGMNRAEAVGLAVVGGNLGQEFIIGNAGGGDEVEAFANLLLDFAGDIDGQFNARLVLGNVEEGLVERDRLDDVGVFVEDFVNLFGNRLIDLHPSGDEDKVGAEPLRRNGGHGGVDAELARLIAGCGDDTSLVGVADGDRLAAQFGIVALFNGGVEGIHIDMYDTSEHTELLFQAG